MVVWFAVTVTALIVVVADWAGPWVVVAYLAFSVVLWGVGNRYAPMGGRGPAAGNG